LYKQSEHYITTALQINDSKTMALGQDW